MQRSETDSSQLVRVGRLTKPHGIKGEVKVQPDFGSVEDFLAYREILLGSPDSELRRDFKVERCRFQGDLVILQLAGVGDRTAADALRGSEVWVDRELLPELLPGRYYRHDLIGMRVETENGRKLGRVETFLATGGHDILVVLDGGREYLIPLVDEFLLNVDAAAGLLTVAEVPGLFEIND
ncbi:MAG: ribosome maturation factor RimM [Desulfurivibrionaceae bacterium]|nr:ribosome maturation factor RimM [Desulfobulbales bacterium]MDT8335985.1 ribosome maturation factor RimM [Desulfurivibrionaceae bacterium]